MVRIALALVAALLVLAPVAGAGSGFKNRTAFQSYVAGVLHVRAVSCAKLSARIADCLGSDHHRYVVACATAGGDRCLIRRYA